MINAILENNKIINDFQKDIRAIKEQIKDEFLKEVHLKYIKPLFEKYSELHSINWFYNDEYNDEYYYLKSSFKVNDLTEYGLEEIEHDIKYKNITPQINVSFYNDVFNELRKIFSDVLEEQQERDYGRRQSGVIATFDIIYDIFANNDFNIKFTEKEIELEENLYAY